MHYAAEWKLDNAVSVLLSKGADANVKNSNGETPIFNAIKSDSTSTIDLLLRKNAKKNERDYLGNTPMHNCIRWNAKNSAMKLIQWKADLNLKNLAGKTPLAQAAHSGRIALATLLLENGANIDETDATGKTVLIDAIQSNSTEMVAMLLKKGASPQVQEIYGRNAYHEAVFNGNINIIKLVRQYGGNPLSRDAQGITPFSLAIKQSPEIIAAVLGDSKNLMDSDGNTPVHIAIENGAPDSVINYLLSIGFPINARNRNGSTALSIAVEKNNPGHVRSLLLKDADPFIESINERSPLIITLEKSTASTDNFKLLDTFIEIMENKTDYQGEGIIHYAAKIADKNTIQHILEKNIDRTVRNINGETASDIAIRWGRKEIGAMLK